MAEAFVTSSSFEIDGPYLFDYSVNANYTGPRIKVAKYIFFPNATSISGYENCQVERIFAPKCTNFNNAFNGNTILRELYVPNGTGTITNSFNGCHNLHYIDIRGMSSSNSFSGTENLQLVIADENTNLDNAIKQIDVTTENKFHVYIPNGLSSSSSLNSLAILHMLSDPGNTGYTVEILQTVDHGIYRITDELYVVPGEDSINTNGIGGDYKVLFAIDATTAGASFLSYNDTIKEFVAPYLKNFNNLALTQSTIEYMYAPNARGFGNWAFQGVLLKSPLLFFNEASHTVSFGTNCFMNESGRPHHIKFIIQENPEHTKAIDIADGALNNVQIDLIGYRSPDEALLYYGQDILDVADYYQTVPTYFYGNLRGYVAGKNLSPGRIISGDVEMPLTAEIYTLKNSLNVNSGTVIDKSTKVLKSGVYSNSNLDKIELLNCESLANDALNGAQIEEIYTPNVHTVGDRAFANNNKIKGAYLSIFFDTMGDSIFENCTNLNYAYADASYIPPNCFKGCTSLKGIFIGPYCTQIYSSALPSSVDLYVLPRDGAYIKITKDIEEKVDCNIYYFDVNDVGAIIQDDDGGLNILISTQEPSLIPFESTLYANVLTTVHDFVEDRTKVVSRFAYCLNSKWISNVGIRNTLSYPVKYSWGFYPAYFYHNEILDIGNLLIEARQPDISSDNDSNMELNINKVPVISNQWLIFPSEV